MTREQLKITLAANYADTMPDYVDGNCVRGLEEGYKKGWDAADEHQKNPWRDAKKELPPIDESDERVSIVVIAKWFVDYDCYIHEAAVYSYEHKRWESTIGKYKTPPDYWMPIPQIKKGD